MSLIKEVSLPRYEVRMLQLENDKFVIEHETSAAVGLQVSEMITDYHTADFLFNLKLDELEGN